MTDAQELAKYRRAFPKCPVRLVRDSTKVITQLFAAYRVTPEHQQAFYMAIGCRALDQQRKGNGLR